MHSIFVTPPDYLNTVLIIDASTEQANAVASFVRESQKPYNIYLYHIDMNDQPWLEKVAQKADVILQMQGSLVNLETEKIWVGPEQKFTNPVDYFAK
jgi:hypothetical protein